MVLQIMQEPTRQLTGEWPFDLDYQAPVTRWEISILPLCGSLV